MFELKLTFSTAEALYDAVAKLAGETVAAPVVTPLTPPTPTAEPAKRGPGRPRKEKDAETAPVADAPVAEASQIPVLMVEEAVAETPAPQADAHAEAQAEAPVTAIPSAEEVKAAAERFNAAHGIAKLKQVLSKFNAARISEIDPADRAAFIAACGV